MASKIALLEQIRSTLGDAIHPSFSTRSASHDLYEAYIFSLVLRAARVEGATSIQYRCSRGGTPQEFVFRTSPGYLNSLSQNYGYAQVNFDRCPEIEVHAGVRVEGNSGVLHECDVSVLFKEEADLCRAGVIRAPRSSKVVLAVEAKFYSVDLSLHLGRGFLGLCTDFSADSLFFVINRSSESIEKLLAHHNCAWENMIEPENKISVFRFFDALRSTFKNFKAKNRV
jgi:hypothetical protein